ncbi:hypothetical protein AYI70_g9235 [Smittium culicis]|uniref:CCHC-type domain-containing protein n=1 Tax=Smittium culicis TaxID=133412 RepID=A0A1R1XC99_9FUNG|nr:hypothetical protein AYI70_g9235 [Smittium culicis]
MVQIQNFDGNRIAFKTWMLNVDEIFENNPSTLGYKKRAMVTASLTGEARMWYDSEPDENLKNWETYRASLKRQFEGTKNIGNAIYILDHTKLELSFLYSEFILRVRPAIGMISGGNKTISIALLRKCLRSEISRHLPGILDEKFESFETRVRSQHEIMTGNTGQSQVLYKTQTSRVDDPNSMDFDMLPVTINSRGDGYYGPTPQEQEILFAARRINSNYYKNVRGYNNFRGGSIANRGSGRYNFSGSRDYNKEKECYLCRKVGHISYYCPEKKQGYKFNPVVYDNHSQSSGKDQVQ